MAIDYDAPRTDDREEIETDSLEGLQAAEDDGRIDDNDDGEIVEPLELPGVELAGEELEVQFKPRQDNEFTCGSCFLVMNRRMIAYVPEDGGLPICEDCA
ncbi:DUF4193 family protein [Corynebacterium sp. 335C]